MAGRPRHRTRRPHRHPDAVGQLRAVRGDPLDAGKRRRICAGRRGRSRRTCGAGVHRGRRGGDHHRAGSGPRPGVVARLASGIAAGPRRRLDHLHVRVDGYPEGGCGHPSQRRGVRRRRGTNVLAGQSDRSGRSRARRPVRCLRRLLRRDVVGLAARRVPGSGATLAGPQRDGPGAVAGVARHHGGVHGADACGPVARRGA